MDVKSTINNVLVEIQAGQVELRDDRINQKWMVNLDSFFISKYPVTQDLYYQVTNENPSVFKGDKRPVENVNWVEAANFCNALSNQLGLKPYYCIKENEQVGSDKTAEGYRLPTEAEWQYACRAGTVGVRYGELDLIAWYKNNSENKTQPVGMKEPNPWGLFDMLGNVWEWCSDLYDTEVYGTYRIFRGGGWNDEERSLMATVRRRSHPSKFKIEDLGFRIAKNK